MSILHLVLIWFLCFSKICDSYNNFVYEHFFVSNNRNIHRVDQNRKFQNVLVACGGFIYNNNKFLYNTIVSNKKVILCI